jgi:putative membrane protein
MMGPWGWIWMLVWIAALLFMVWLIVRSPSEHSTAEDAMTILRARFARGEISQEEFERARIALLVDTQEFIR